MQHTAPQDRVLDMLESERDYYEARADRALEKGNLSAHEYWARKYHAQLHIISDRRVATAARQARQAQDECGCTGDATCNTHAPSGGEDDWQNANRGSHA